MTKHRNRCYPSPENCFKTTCVACGAGYKIPRRKIGINNTLAKQKAELLSKIKAVGSEEGIDQVTVARILNKLQ